VPGEKYAAGFNTGMGDKNVIWNAQGGPYFSSLRSNNSSDIKVLKEQMEKLKANATV